MSNTIKTDKGIEVYESKIHELADEYIRDLAEDDSECNMLIRKSPVFKGMLKYIYINLFKITDKDIRYNNKNSSIDYSNIDLINSIWDIYTSLCYKYLQSPTLLNFSMLTGIDMTTFDDWRKGEMRGTVDKLGSPHSQSAKRWLKECEGAAYDVALNGGIGGMFILKANYGYTETAQQLIITNGDQHKTIEQIAAEHTKSIEHKGDTEIPDADF